MNTPESVAFLSELESIIHVRLQNPNDYSYTAKLANEGIARVAQKVGEEATEVAIASVTDAKRAEVANEAADLLYHLLVLLAVRGIPLGEVVAVLANRHAERQPDAEE